MHAPLQAEEDVISDWMSVADATWGFAHSLKLLFRMGPTIRLNHDRNIHETLEDNYSNIQFLP